ncbi:hypothetical protein AB4Z46_19715 [Variovorax sp. M-6]|uniref:hypothetical protein n=1 Tax=Variovorax sp. M-6 TaxID=3233041 RepID=UPI003F99B130
MTQACVDCLTDNRDGAKFCKGCGKRLVSLTPVGPAAVTGGAEQWPATQRMPMRSKLPTPPAPSPRRPVPAPAAASRRRVEPAESRTRSTPQRTAAGRSNPWRSAVIGLLIVAGLVAIAAWFFSEPPRPAIPPAPSLAANSPTPPAPVLVEPAALLATPPPDEPSAAAPAPTPTPTPTPSAPPSVVAPPAAPLKPAPAAPKSRKPAPPPAPVAALPAPSPEESPPPPAAPPSPRSQCGGLNFFARAQCLAAQCAKPELKSNAECDAVRRQQQIEEERRNPTLLN